MGENLNSRAVARYMDSNHDGRLQASEGVRADLEILRCELLFSQATHKLPRPQDIKLYASMDEAKYIDGSTYLRDHNALWPNGVEIPNHVQAEKVVAAMHKAAEELKDAHNTSWGQRWAAAVALWKSDARINTGLALSAVMEVISPTRVGTPNKERYR